MRDLLADLTAENDVLDELLSHASPDGWRAPTPAAGWDVAQTVQHLISSERAARASVAHDHDPYDGPLPGSTSQPDRVAPDALLQQWRAARLATHEALAARDDADRVPWGGRRMSVRSLATARLMECWAHGLDCFAALDVTPVDTDRLEHIAWLGWRTLPYAFAVAGETPPAPPESLRLEVRSPTGALWEIGPAVADSAVSGDAGVWCRVVTHRWRDTGPRPLETDGALARRCVAVARAFL